MAYNLVSLILDLTDGTGALIGQGSCRLNPSAQLVDATDNLLVVEAPVWSALQGVSAPSVKLLATDNANLAPSGWAWTISFPGVPGSPPGFNVFAPAGPLSFTATDASPCVFTWAPTSQFTVMPDNTGVQLSGGSLPAGFNSTTVYYVVNASGYTFQLALTVGGSPLASGSSGSGSLTVSSYFLSSLSPVSSVTAMAAYMPLPSGTPGAGQVPVATGSGEASAWGSAGGGAVSSVFGRTGAVVAGSGDYSVGQVTGAAPLASPALTGTPTAPTASPLTDTAQLASTAYADAAVAVEKSRAQTTEALLAPLASPALTGSPTAPTKTALTNNTDIATTAYADSAVAVEKTRAQAAEALLAPLASPALTGTPTAPTPAGGDNSAKLATTAFVDAALPTALPPSGPASGDLGGSYPSPTVTATHLSSALPIAQGGTGSTSRNFAGLLTPTAVKTTTYTAAAGDFVPCDTTSGGFTVTLPNAPADLSVVGIKQVIQGGTNTVTVACAGSDVFNKTGGATSGTLTLVAQGMLLQYKASGGIWYVLADDLALPQLDARYAQLANNLSDLASASSARTNLGLGSAATVSVPVSLANGGTGTNAGSANAAFNALSPMTTAGDTLYGGTSGAGTRLAGPTSSTKQFLTSTGTGSAANAPAWGTIAAGDVPTLNQNTSGTAAGLSSTLAIGSGGTGQTTQQAAMDALAGATTSGDYLRGNGSHVVMAAIAAADLPAATTSMQGAVILDGTASDIAATGTQAAGNSTKGAAGNHVHPAPCWTVADSGLLAANFSDPAIASSTQIMIAGTLYLLRVNIYQAFTWTNVIVGVTSAGVNTGGSAGTFAGLYNSSGTLLSGSSDVAVTLTSSGTRSLPLTTPQALSAGTFVWVALLANLGATQPTVGRSAATATLYNLNLAAASFRVAINGTSLTALPSSITPASNTATNSLAFWVGAT